MHTRDLCLRSYEEIEYITISNGAVKTIAPFLSAWTYEIFPSFLYKSAIILDFKSKIRYTKIV